jgi:hypothetical protein
VESKIDMCEGKEAKTKTKTENRKLEMPFVAALFLITGTEKQML